MTPTLSVVIASAGRRLSLGDTLAALVPQFGEGDEAMVVFDGPPTDDVARVVQAWRAQSAGVATRWIPGPRHDWGMAARNWALDTRLALGEWLLWIDDDDAHRPGALAAVRSAIAEAPAVPLLFRVEVHAGEDGGTIWTDQVVREGNVTTQGIVTPNVASRLGRWGNRYAGDFDFIRDTVALYSGHVVWRPEVIADVFPTRDR